MSKADNVKEILETRREFLVENIGEESHNLYYIANPTGEDIRKSDWQYAKIYNQAIVDEFLTQAQMLELLKQKGILDDAYTKELGEIKTKLAAELYRLEILDEEVEDEEKEDLANSVALLREELFRLNQKINGPLGNTCENLAEDARVEFLTSRLIQKKDGGKLWDDFENFRAEENTALAIKSRFEVMLWMQGLDSDFMEQAPEQRALREIQQSRFDEALKELEEGNKAAAEEEAKKKEESSEVEELDVSKVETKPKKRGRPKKTTPKKKTSKKKDE